MRAPATGKARRPTVEGLTAGTNRLSATEDRSLCRDATSYGYWRRASTVTGTAERQRPISLHHGDLEGDPFQHP